MPIRERVAGVSVVAMALGVVTTWTFLRGTSCSELRESGKMTRCVDCSLEKYGGGGQHAIVFVLVSKNCGAVLAQ